MNRIQRFIEAVIEADDGGQPTPDQLAMLQHGSGERVLLLDPDVAAELQREGKARPEGRWLDADARGLVDLEARR